MPLIAPQCARFAVNAVINDRPCVNILDMQVDTTGSTTSRPAALALVLCEHQGDTG